MPTRRLPLLPRDPAEPGRAASPLELFFDLVFVVAVSVASVSLHHELTEGHVVDGIVSYVVVFFAIWWAWMNFTWFATSFSNDDWLYRTLTIVQMGGVLILAAGIENVFKDGDFRVVIGGYVVMRLALVAQWLRAAHDSPEYRATAKRYATGIVIVQALWLTLLFFDGTVAYVLWAVFVVAEMAVPVVAERPKQTPWHAHHITERYGLFTLILLGESLLGSANAIIDALHEGEHVPELLALAALVLATTAALWWIYFYPPHHARIGTMRESLTYGYGHIFILAAAGALSSGVEVVIDSITDHSELSAVAASYTATVPIAIFLLGDWLLIVRPLGVRAANIALPVSAVLVLLDPLIPIPVALTTLIMIGVVIVLVRNPAPDHPHPEHQTA